MSWFRRLFGVSSSAGSAPTDRQPAAHGGPPEIAALIAGGATAGRFLEQAAALDSGHLAAMKSVLIERRNETARPLLHWRFPQKDSGLTLSEAARRVTIDVVESIWNVDPERIGTLTRDDDPHIRWAAVQIMAIALMQKRPLSIEHATAKERAEFDEMVRRVLPSLTAALSDAVAEVRGTVVRALGDTGEMRPVEAMLPLADDLDPNVRASWAFALKDTTDPVVMSKILKLASDPAVEVRKYVSSSLRSRLDSADCLAAMRSLANDKSPSVRSSVAGDLKYSAADSATEMLAALSADPDPGVRKAAVGVLANPWQPSQKALFAAVAARFWTSDTSPDAHRAARGTLIPHDVHAGVVRIKRPGRDTAPLEIVGTFRCVSSCNSAVTFVAHVADAPAPKQPIKCQCGVSSSLESIERGGFVWLLVRPLEWRRPLNKDYIGIHIAVTSARIGDARLEPVGRDEYILIWVGDPQEVLSLPASAVSRAAE